MKNTSIIILSILGILVVVMLVSLMNAGTYGTFSEAKLNPDKNLTIIGQLNKQKGIQYNPDQDPNKTYFYLFDKEGDENLVIYHDAKPRDIEQSEEITIEGKMVNGEFHAVHLLMKCPSKYTPDEVQQKEMNPLTY